MFEKIQNWFDKKVAEYRLNRAQRIIEAVDAKDGTLLFNAPKEKMRALLDKMVTAEQVYWLIGGDQENRLGDFRKVPEDIREAFLERLTPDLRKELLRSSDVGSEGHSCGHHFSYASVYNFSYVSPRYQNEFLFDLCTESERLAFLNETGRKNPNMTMMESLIRFHPHIADNVLCALGSKEQMDLLLKQKDNRVMWPLKANEMTQSYLLSLVPFDALTVFLKTPLHQDTEKTVLDALSMEVQKETVRRYARHPHLLQRLVADRMDDLSWPVKTEVALQMNNKKFVFALFKTPGDETGRAGFYQTPYKTFRKAVYEKFPELDVMPKKVDKSNLAARYFADATKMIQK